MNSTVFKLALRDLRNGYRGFWIFFGCLALGVAAITAVTTMSTSILNGIARDGKLILGGDVAAGSQFRALSNEKYEFLLENADEATHFIEMRTLMRTPDASKSTLVELKAVDGRYPLYGEFTVKGVGALHELIQLKNGVWGAVVDAAIVESNAAKIGDSISLGNSTFHITGVIDNEPDRLGGTGTFGFWPRIVVHRDSLDNSGLLAPGSRNFYEYRVKLGEAAGVEDLKQRAEAAHPKLELRDYSNASPRLSELVQRLGVLLSLAGLTTLLIGGVGVSNAVRAYLDSRLSTIAIFKCIGASGRMVFQIYLIQILVLSTIGVATGVVIGSLIPVFSAAVLQQLLSIPVEFAFHLQNVAIVSLYGIATALLFTLWPLACAINTSPVALFRNAVTNEVQTASWKFVAISIALAAMLAAIVVTTAYERRFAIWFVISAALAWLIFRFVSVLIMLSARRFASRRWPIARLAVTNLYRPGSSTSDIVLAVGLGLSVLIATAMVSSNMDKQISELIPERAPTFFFIGVQSAQLEEFNRIVESVEGVRDLKVLPYIPGRIVRIKGMNPEDALVDADGRWLIDDGGERTFSYAAEPPENAEIVAGEWWPQNYSGKPLLSIHKDVADSFALNLGDTITMNILGREIVGEVYNVRDLEWRSMQLNFAIMLSPEPLRQIPHSSVGTAHVPDQHEFDLQDRVASAFPNATVLRVKDALDRVGTYMKRARDAARGISVLTVVAGILVLAGVVVSENRRRAYESVLLKTIGASRRYILAAYSLEYLMQGAITAVVAAVMGSLASWAVVTVLMGWDWLFMPASAVNTAILGLAISLCLGMLGIRNALNHRPLAYLRNE